MRLPDPRTQGGVSVEEALFTRRTVRSFSTYPLVGSQLSQILWAAQGVTDQGKGLRSVPSAGGLYPMELYAAVGEGAVTGLEKGIYRYEPDAHGIERISDRDVRNDLGRASLSQMWISPAPVSLVVCAEYPRVTAKYGHRGERYALIEAGCMAQSISLEARSLGLQTGIVGAFIDEEVIGVLRLPPSHEPLLIMPVGYSR
ncbi:MAG: nitroreductase A [Deltaproteobacteria bacterium ADurb.BinA179]|nr:MAG: nitroreductase A [Deltaproteobacteria bacterium ADurb.BinA179]HOE73940.1 SagB/ThcOx family dehydrogenase [Deltaproteobacteria bacterium]HRT46221.1 SagB/ThcOx family dehydrogenase [Desulfomonilia bacterium]HON60837.1 SagB/ThcOx family dehydrogenase [Deltaproteobacteria bacterium]HOS27111.1 SagB/ThcOx family dehydrogenase [Deltaproteobacteria bacterium]